MRRRLFATLSALSLLLGVAVVGLWVRSYWRCDEVHYAHRDAQNRETGATWCQSSAGFLYCRRSSHTVPIAPAGDRFRYASVAEPWKFTGRGWEFYAGVVGRRVDSYSYYRPQAPALKITGTQISIVMPLWIVTVATCLLPLLWLYMSRLWSAKRHGLCPACGYDLRATPERCPECGREPPAAVVVSGA